MVRVVSVGYSIVWGVTPLDGVAATGGFLRMRVHDCLPPIQFVEHRRKSRIAEPLIVITRQQADAIDLQRIECIFDFLQTAFDIRQRQYGEQPEPALVRSDHLRGGIFVHLASQTPGFIDVAKPDAGRRLREHRRNNAGFLHLRKIAFGRVVSPYAETRHRAGRVLPRQQRVVIRRNEMLMNIDPARFAAWILSAYAAAGEQGAGACRHQAFQEITSRRMHVYLSSEG